MSANLPELISAYLDGEVTAEERAAVEQTLVENATLRRLFYELRALRKQLASLPRYKLKADLSREVLRQAERALLQPSAELPVDQHAAQPVAPDQHTPSASIPTPSVQRPTQWWQAAVWVGAAVAASLLLIVLQPGKDAGPEQIAFTPAKQAEEYKRRELGREVQQPRGETAADPKFAKREKESSPLALESLSKTDPPVDSLAINGDRAMPGPDKGSDKSVVAGATATFSKLSATKDSNQQPEDRAQPNALGSTSGGFQRGGGIQPGGFGGLAGGAPNEKPIEEQAAKGNDGAAAVRYAYDALGDTRLAQADGTVMIRCDVHGREFEPLLRTSLARHNIVWSETASETNLSVKSLEDVEHFRLAAGGRAPGDAPLGDQPKLDQPQPEPKTPPQDPAAGDKGLAPPLAPQSPAASPASSTAASDAELVYVVATQEQIEGVLAELREHPRVFLAANVHPVPGSIAQAELTQWNWSAFAGTDRLLAERDANRPAEADEKKPEEKKAEEKKPGEKKPDDKQDMAKSNKDDAQGRPAALPAIGLQIAADKPAANQPPTERQGVNLAQEESLRDELLKKSLDPPGAATRMRLTADPASQIAGRKIAAFKATTAPKENAEPKGNATSQGIDTSRGIAEPKGVAPSSFDDAKHDDAKHDGGKNDGGKIEREKGDREKQGLDGAYKLPLAIEAQAHFAAPAAKPQPAQRVGGLQTTNGLTAPAKSAPANGEAGHGEAGEIRAVGRAGPAPPLRVLFVFRIQPPAAPPPAAPRE